MLRGLSRQLSTSCARSISAQNASIKTRILVKPLPHASLSNTAGVWFAPHKTHPVYHCDNFSLVLKPFPRSLTKADGTVKPESLVPSWLPQPAHPSTHERRHLRDLVLPSPVSDANEDGKWGPTAASIEELAAKFRNERPVLRSFVLATKKRIHKYAVIRNKVRSRLVSALRKALHQMQVEQRADGQALVDALQIHRNVVVIIASPSAYQCDMHDLVANMRTAISRITTRPVRSAPRVVSGAPPSRPALFRSKTVIKLPSPK